jgi:hypothetical protein
MRPFILALAALIAGGPVAAQSVWKLYPEVTEGFLLNFPGEPQVDYNTKWELVPGRLAPATVYSVKYNNAVFKMTVVDANETYIKEDPIVAQTIRKIGEGGKLNHSEPTRVEGLYGREISVARPDGTTTLAVIFYVNERLYIDETTGPSAASSDMFLFLRSLVFDSHVKNRTKEQLDAWWYACTRGATKDVIMPLQPSGPDDPRCAHD